MPSKNTPDHYTLTSDLVGHDDGKLSLTLPIEHTVEHDHSVAIKPGLTEHIIIARAYCPALPSARSWLVVYRVDVTTDRQGWKSRSYGAFNYARSMDEAKQMSDDLIGYAHKFQDEMAQRMAEIELPSVGIA